MKKAPNDLCTKIILRIDLLEKRADRRRLFGSSFLAALSIFLIYLSGQWFYRDLSASGFLSSFNLLFTDSTLVFSYWNDFSSMLIEALPILSLVSFLGALLVTVFSVGYLSRYRALHLHRRSVKLIKTNFA